MNSVVGDDGCPANELLNYVLSFFTFMAAHQLPRMQIRLRSSSPGQALMLKSRTILRTLGVSTFLATYMYMHMHICIHSQQSRKQRNHNSFFLGHTRYINITKDNINNTLRVRCFMRQPPSLLPQFTNLYEQFIKRS